MAKNESYAWAIKNKWGSILTWTIAYLRRDVIGKVGGLLNYQRNWKDKGHEIIKVKIVDSRVA